jgi:hypothetical protein
LERRMSIGCDDESRDVENSPARLHPVRLCACPTPSKSLESFFAHATESN